MSKEVIHILFKGDTHSNDYVEEFNKNNLKAVSVPALTFEYQHLDQLVKLLKSANGLIITSPRVVEALAIALKTLDANERDDILKRFHPDLVFVVGHKSGQECFTKLNLSYNKQSAASGDGKTLSSFIRSFCNQKSTYHLLNPKSSRADSTVEDGLIDSEGIQVQSVVVYQTSPAENLEISAIKELRQINIPKQIKALTLNLIFFSPSGIESFLKVDQDSFIEQVRRTFSLDCGIAIKFSGIGKTTEAALLRNCCIVSCVSDKPDPISLVGSIMKYNFW